MFLEGRVSLNDDFLKNSSDVPLISVRELVLIVVGGLVSTSIVFLISSAMYIGDIIVFANMLNTVNTVGMTLAIGGFPFLVAGLLFSSRDSRLYLKIRIDRVGIRSAYLTRVLHVIIITSIFTIIATIIGFTLPILFGSLSGFPVNFSSLVFLPAGLTALLIVSILISLVASGVANIVDDSRLNTLLGCSVGTVIALVAGFYTNTRVWHFSITRNLSLLSPHNIARGLAFQLSGYQFETPREMIGFVGYVANSISFVIVLGLFCLVGIVLILIGERVLVRNAPRWSVLKSMVPVDEEWDAKVTPEFLKQVRQVRRSLRFQRGVATLIVCIIISSLYVGGSMYQNYITNVTTTIHYATPGVSEEISTGIWHIYDINSTPLYPGLFTQITSTIFVITLGNTSGTVSMFVGNLNISASEFELLDETSRLELTTDWLNQSSGVGFGVSEIFQENPGPLIFVILIVSDSHPSTPSYIDFNLHIEQTAR